MKYHGSYQQLVFFIKRCSLILICLFNYNFVFAQTPTPIIVNLITPTPISAQQAIATVTPTFTPTSKGPVLLEVKESSGSVNVRREPDPNGERLGSIENGTQYPVLRQYFLWYEFQYELSPTGRAWVYGELVDVIGEQSEIVSVDTLDTSTTDDTSITETWVAITSVSGGIETATADARVLILPTSESSDISGIIELTPLPTYTYPSNAIDLLQTTNPQIIEDSTQNSEKVEIRTAPIFSILMLASFGILGLLINSLRG